MRWLQTARRSRYPSISPFPVDASKLFVLAGVEGFLLETEKPLNHLHYVLTFLSSANG